MKTGTSVAKATKPGNRLSAALKRCATQNRDLPRGAGCGPDA